MIKLTEEEKEKLIDLKKKVDAAVSTCGKKMPNGGRHKWLRSSEEQKYEAAVLQLHGFGFKLGIFSPRSKNGSYYSYEYA